MTEQKSKGRVFFMSPLSSCAYLRATYLLKTFCYISKVSLLLWGHNLLYFFSYSLLNTILNNPLQIILTNSHVCIWIQWLSFVHRNGCNFSVPLSESNSSGRQRLNTTDLEVLSHMINAFNLIGMNRPLYSLWTEQ